MLRLLQIKNILASKGWLLRSRPCGSRSSTHLRRIRHSKLKGKCNHCERKSESGKVQRQRFGTNLVSRLSIALTWTQSGGRRGGRREAERGEEIRKAHRPSTTRLPAGNRCQLSERRRSLDIHLKIRAPSLALRCWS